MHLPKIVYDTEEYVELNDSDNLIISSFEGMVKFGYLPYDYQSIESLKKDLIIKKKYN